MSIDNDARTVRPGHAATYHNAARSREADLDGMLHIELGACCRSDRPCPRCGGRLHLQGAYHGMMELCERCPGDSGHWHVAGTLVSDGVTIDGVRRAQS